MNDANPNCPKCNTQGSLVAAEVRQFGVHICLRVAWRAWHTEACCLHLEDPGATCICRPPHTESHAVGFGR